MRPDPTSPAWPLAGALAAALFTLGNVALFFDVRRHEDARERSDAVLDALNDLELNVDSLPEAIEPMSAEDGPLTSYKNLSDAMRARIERLRAETPLDTSLEKGLVDFERQLAELGTQHPLLVEEPASFVLTSPAREDYLRQAKDIDRLVHSLRDKQSGIDRQISAQLTGRSRLSQASLFIACGIAGISTWLLRRNQLHVLDQRRTQAKLQETQNRLAAVVANAPLAVWSVDREGRFTLFEGAAFQTLGCKQEERIGHSVFEVHRDDAVVVDAHRRALLGESVDYQVDLDGVRLRCLLLPLRDASANVTGALGIGTDVTEYERAKAEMRRADLQRIENQKAEAIGKVAGGVAHEFSNLLTVITGFASLLRTNPDLGAQDLEDVQQILKASARASELTQQLLAYSRRQRTEPRVVDANTLLTDARKTIETLLQPRVTVEILTTPEPLAVRVDPGQFQQVLLNLALNARDATPMGGRFTMAASLVRRAELDPTAMLAPDDYVCLSFADTGKGMDEETQARAFDPFFTTKGPQRGTGLGLPLVQGILRQAGGDVTVKSTLGEGTTFRLYLPWVEDAEIELDSDTKELALPPGRETILLAEDEAMVRAFTARVLRRAGYEVIEAGDGGAALQAARAYVGHIALLITDVVMPELDGPALARRFAELRPGIPVVFLSGYAHEDGALEYLQKPFTPQELCRLVRARLDAENGLRPPRIA